VQVARILMFATILGPASGPVLGGLLIDTLSWRWAFYVNVPVGLISFLIGLFFLHEHREPTAGRFDLPGFCLAGAGFALVMYALSEGPSHGWTSPGILITAFLGIVVLAIFASVELRTPTPMVQLHLLTNRLFRSTLTTSLFASAGFVGVLFLVPLFLQEVRGASPLASGLTTFPEALGVVCSTQIVARLYPRFGPRRLMFGGLLGVATAIALLCTVQLDTNTWLVRLLMFMIGVGMAYVFLPNQAASLATISRAATGRATTLFSAQRQLGAALGVAVLSSVLAAVGPTHIGAGGAIQPNLTAYRAAFLAAACLSIAGALFALRVPDADAAATMHARASKEVTAEPPRDPIPVDAD
jgi:EmrB/QacA subfamily drug resistance transporter